MSSAICESASTPFSECVQYQHYLPPIQRPTHHGRQTLHTRGWKAWRQICDRKWLQGQLGERTSVPLQFSRGCEQRARRPWRPIAYPQLINRITIRITKACGGGASRLPQSRQERPCLPEKVNPLALAALVLASLGYRAMLFQCMPAFCAILTLIFSLVSLYRREYERRRRHDGSLPIHAGSLNIRHC